VPPKDPSFFRGPRRFLRDPTPIGSGSGSEISAPTPPQCEVYVQLPKGFLVLLSEELKIFTGELEVFPGDIGIRSLRRPRSFVAFQVRPYRYSVGKVG
jgi:hypothetical protein